MKNRKVSIVRPKATPDEKLESLNKPPLTRAEKPNGTSKDQKEENRRKNEEHIDIKKQVLEIAQEVSKLELGAMEELERFTKKGVRDFYTLLTKARKTIQPTPMEADGQKLEFRVYDFRIIFDSLGTILKILLNSNHSEFVQAITFLTYVDHLLSATLEMPVNEFLQLQREAEGNTVGILNLLPKDQPIRINFVTTHRLRQCFGTIVNFYPPHEPMSYSQTKQLIFQDMVRIADESIEAQKQTYLQMMAEREGLRKEAADRVHSA